MPVRHVACTAGATTDQLHFLIFSISSIRSSIMPVTSDAIALPIAAGAPAVAGTNVDDEVQRSKRRC